MAGRFAPPPTVRAYARRRLACSSNDRIAVLRHGALRHCRTRALTRHAFDRPSPLQFHCSSPQPQRWPSMRRRPDLPPSPIRVRTRCAAQKRIVNFLRLIHICRHQRQTVFRNIRIPGSPISIPRCVLHPDPGAFNRLYNFCSHDVRVLFSPFAVYILSRNVV